MKVAIYVLDKQAKQNYKEESFDTRMWPGLAIIKDMLVRNGIELGYCGVATAHEYDVILMSIHSDCDWWPFITERVRWKPGRYKVIVGGAGILNIRPFLVYSDAFVFGRAETFVTDLVREAAAGREYQHESVAWASNFFPGNKYVICQGDGPYPHVVTLENGRPFREKVMGCQNKCLFCGYTWQRKNVGGNHEENTTGESSLWGAGQEKTILGLDMDHPEEWQKEGPLRIVAIDGFSERLRKKINKPISRERLRMFYTGLSKIEKPHQVKIYNLVGLPTETIDDWREFLEDIRTVDGQLDKGPQWPIILHNTPFRAMPATPVSHWPMSYRNYRGEIARQLKESHHKGNIFYQGNKFWCVESMGTDSLSSHALSAIALRGTEADAAGIRKVATSSKFWHASAPVRIATLQHYFDLDKLFGEYPIGQTPTEYLSAWWKPQQRMAAKQESPS